MKFNFQIAALRFVAIALSALMAILAFSGIQAIARAKMTAWQPYRFILARSSAPAQEESSLEAIDPAVSPWSSWQLTPQAATSVPAPVPVVPNRPTRPTRPTASATPPSPAASSPTLSTRSAPPQQVAAAHPTNYGDRYSHDIMGKPVQNEPIIVLHETVGSADSAIQVFQTPHMNENDQVSYHALIRADGTIVYVVAPGKRAFGAGNSAFNGAKGIETVKTHRLYPPSVNNFAYHISLETPADGQDNEPTHSGYTDAQYQSLAWLVARTPVLDERITTHRQVDRSGSRLDPRSFDREKLMRLLSQYPRPSMPSGETN